MANLTYFFKSFRCTYLLFASFGYDAEENLRTYMKRRNYLSKVDYSFFKIGIVLSSINKEFKHRKFN